MRHVPGPTSPREHIASRSRPTRSGSPVRGGLVVLGLLVLAGGAFAGWYLFLRPVPAAVSLATLPPSSTAAAGAASSAPSPATPAATSSTGGSNAPSSGTGVAALDGPWTVDPSIGSFSDFSSSFAGYRVQETLGSIGANTAVGRTPNVSGTLTLSGAIISSVDITVDMTTLVSDNDMRDGRLASQAIEYGTYPTSTFKLTSPIDLGAAPTEGQTASVTATGDLTLHGVTKRVQIALQAQLSGGVITVVGSLPSPLPTTASRSHSRSWCSRSTTTVRWSSSSTTRRPEAPDPGMAQSWTPIAIVEEKPLVASPARSRSVTPPVSR